MKYSVFFFEGDLSSEDLRKTLTIEAIGAYCHNHNIDFNPETIAIKKGEKGKPYIEGPHVEGPHVEGSHVEGPHIDGQPVHFNVSHSGNLWLCMVGAGPCGIDIQVARDCDYEKIAEKHFDVVEQAYVKAMGLTGFFQLWTRREAYGKFTGEGFYGKMPAFMDFEGRLLEKAGGAFIKDIYIADDIFCVYCTGGEDDEIEFFGR